MFQLFSISLLVYVASCPRGRASPSDAHPFAAPASLPRSFRSRDFLSSRLASFRDCKFLDVGLKGAETFRGRAAVAVSHSVTRTLTRTLPESIFRLSAGRPVGRLTHEPSNDDTSSPIYQISPSRFPTTSESWPFPRSVCNFIAVKNHAAKHRPNARPRTSRHYTLFLRNVTESRRV